MERKCIYQLYENVCRERDAITENRTIATGQKYKCDMCVKYNATQRYEILHGIRFFEIA